MALHDLVGSRVERVAVDERRQLGAPGRTVTPQLMVRHGVAELATETEEQLVSVVGREVELVGDLGRAELMTQLQVEQTGVARAERCRCRPDQALPIASVADLFGLEHPVRADGIFAVVPSTVLSFVEPGHDITVERVRSAFLLEPVERPVAAGAKQPPTESLGIIELVEPLPGREEDILCDLGRGVVVAHDVASDVVDPVEPAFEELPERRRIFVGGSNDQLGIGPLGAMSDHWSKYCIVHLTITGVPSGSCVAKTSMSSFGSRTQP